MYNENELTPAQQELEAALRQVRPAQDGPNRELFWFNAGRASARTARPWQVLSGALTILLLCSLLIRPDVDLPQRESAPVQFAAQQGISAGEELLPDEPAQASAYLALRQRIVRRGLDALPSQASTPGTSMTRPQNQTLWLERML